MNRKLAAVRISPRLIESWLKSTGDECVFHSIEGVPADSEMVDMRYNFEEGVYHALFTNDTFDEVKAGEKVPVITPTITTYYV